MSKIKGIRMVKTLITILLFVLLWANSAYSELIDNGNGTITDTDTNLMWLKDANYAMTSGYDTTFGGRMTWEDSIIWADNLTYANYDDWRLPSAFNSNGSGPCYGYCNDSEMGHLYYIELGNAVGGPLTNSGLFNNLQEAHSYWTSTSFAPNNDKWDFSFADGFQSWHWPNSASSFAWSVRDITIIPEPISSLLFAIGGSFLSSYQYIRRKRS